jgi:hypothetical protein
MKIHRYRVTFTDGRSSRCTMIGAPDIELACETARTLADVIMRERAFGDSNYAAWCFIVDSGGDEGVRTQHFHSTLIQLRHPRFPRIPHPRLSPRRA